MMSTSFAPVVSPRVLPPRPLRPLTHPPRLARGGALKQAAERVRASGRGGDTELVHLHPREHEALKLIYGPGRQNPGTGLPEHDLFGDILGGIGDVASGVGSFLFGSGGSGGGSGALGDIISAVSGLFGGGPTMGAPGGYANQVYGPSQASGVQGQSGGSGSSSANLSRLLNLGGGLASFVGALNQSRSAANSQKKLLHRQQQLQNQQNQHVSYPIGTGNPVYSSPAPFSSSLAGVNPAYPYLQYAEGGQVDPNPDDLGDNLGGGPAAGARPWAERVGGWGNQGMADGRAGRPPDVSERWRHGVNPVMATSGSPLPTLLPPPRGSFFQNPGLVQPAGTGTGVIPGGWAAARAQGPTGFGMRRGGALSHPQGRVPGRGTGQSDEVPAYLSKDEYVVPADVVSHLGDGSSEAGAQVLDKKVAEVRRKRTGNSKFPPRAGALSLGGR